MAEPLRLLPSSNIDKCSFIVTSVYNVRWLRISCHISFYSLRRRSANIPFLQRVVLCAQANFFHFDTLELVLSLANMTWKLKLMLATPNCHFLANEDSVTMINTTNVYWATLLGNAVLQTQELRTAVTKSSERRHWLGCSYAINKLHRHILPLRWHCVGIIKCEKSM